MSFRTQFVTKYFKLIYGNRLFHGTTYQYFMPIYHISSLTYFILYQGGRAWYFSTICTVSAMGRKINNIYYEDLQLLGSHVSQTVFHAALFESVLTWGHITTSTCRSLIVVGALRVPLFVGGESGIFAYSPPLFGYTTFLRRHTSIVHGVYP
jgi:hypothetical protein